MQIIELHTDTEDFFCPVTGNHIQGEEHFEPSPALRGMWLTEIEDEPMVDDPDFLEAWENYYEKFRNDDEGWLDMREFFESIEKPNWVVFEFHRRGIACGPVFSTQWLVIDMGHEKES